ncbi:DUF6221 family protein [Streptomyces sp. NPDC008222]|uniref:DUF6221 family protein n=1 Tax=Streptomyces sp. NPDC008222 TaxID=3364820 RepID=UPI0036EFDD8D
MDELVRWLGEQLDTDERIARAATQGPWSVDSETYAESINAGDGTQVVAGGRWGGEASVFESTEDALHIVRHDPSRVLRDIEAKRQLVKRYERAMENRRAHPDDLASVGALLALHGAVKLLALPYADRPGYREEWRP